MNYENGGICTNGFDRTLCSPSSFFFNDSTLSNNKRERNKQAQRAAASADAKAEAAAL